MLFTFMSHANIQLIDIRTGVLDQDTSSGALDSHTFLGSSL